MLGDGTKLGVTTDNPPPARLLDLTRLVSRAGRVATGVDRVALAYLSRLIKEAVPVYGLVRTAPGYLLLDREGMRALLARCRGEIPWGPVDGMSHLAFRLTPAQKRGQSDARRLSFARAPRQRLSALLARNLPSGIAYVNVGHTNLSERAIRALHGINARITVMIHDTIPLDFPQYQYAGSVTRFRELLRRTRQSADLVLYNSHQTRMDAERHMSLWGAPPRGLVAHLGIDPPRPDARLLPANLLPDAPYFVTVGTIEPRKNHILLLDIWESLMRQPLAAMPHLFICGSRGWKNETFFERFDQSPLKGTLVHELHDLSDEAIHALLSGAAAALFPSHAEGYGLPPIEAATLEIPVICQDLVIYREVLRDIPIYAEADNRYRWEQIIVELTKKTTSEQEPAGSENVFLPPTWDSHFNKVLKLT